MVAADPDNAKGHLYLGISYEDAKNSAGALAEFTKAAELDDSLAEAYYRKGRLLRTQKQTAEGLVALQKAESLDSGNADYLTELGIAHYESQQLQPALEALEKAVTSPEYANALVWAYYGVTLKDSQRYAEAVDNFQKAVAAFPNYGLAHWGLAWSAFGQISAGCPCTPEDDALVALIVDHSAKAVEYGVNDPGLQGALRHSWPRGENQVVNIVRASPSRSFSRATGRFAYTGDSGPRGTRGIVRLGPRLASR